ncbi:hypothetical protein DPMN_194377, partial [Dreissena polymorpha]
SDDDNDDNDDDNDDDDDDDDDDGDDDDDDDLSHSNETCNRQTDQTDEHKTDGHTSKTYGLPERRTDIQTDRRP